MLRGVFWNSLIWCGPIYSTLVYTVQSSPAWPSLPWCCVLLVGFSHLQLHRQYWRANGKDMQQFRTSALTAYTIPYIEQTTINWFYFIPYPTENIRETPMSNSPNGKLLVVTPQPSVEIFRSKQFKNTVWRIGNAKQIDGFVSFLWVKKKTY